MTPSLYQSLTPTLPWSRPSEPQPFFFWSQVFPPPFPSGSTNLRACELVGLYLTAGGR